MKGCTNRFTHANRRCTLHPRSGVRRTEPVFSERSSSATKVLKQNKNIGNTMNSSEKPVKKSAKSDKRKDCPRRSVIARVGRASRKLHHELDAEADEENDDNKEKIMGALALMELAGSAPIDIGSEVCVSSNENEEQIHIPTTFVQIIWVQPQNKIYSYFQKLF